jgi:hypothetical protein
LADTGVDSNRGEIAFTEQLVELSGTEGGFDEDNDLIELKTVEEVIEFSVLLGFIELDAVLLQTVESELGLIVDVDFERIPHEFLADRPNLLRECGTEHHDLLLSRGSSEDFLDVAAHV